MMARFCGIRSRLGKQPNRPGRRATTGALERSRPRSTRLRLFLCERDVFTSGLIEAYIRYKRESEVDVIRMRPHPWEFALYHDA
jgi:glutamine synthetase